MSMDVSTVLSRLGVEYSALRSRIDELVAENRRLREQIRGQAAHGSGSVGAGLKQAVSDAPEEQTPHADRFCSNQGSPRASPSRLAPPKVKHAAIVVPPDSCSTASFDAAASESERFQTYQPELLGMLDRPTLSAAGDDASRSASSLEEPASEAAKPLRSTALRSTLRSGSLSSEQREDLEQTKVDVLKRVTRRATRLEQQQQRLMSSSSFAGSDSARMRVLIVDSALGVLVILNTITIGISADLESENPKLWILIDASFAFLFLSELIFKLHVVGCRSYFCGHDRRWGLFEAALVAFALLEVVLSVMKELKGADHAQSPGSPGLSLFRIVRLLRITRILRLVRLDMFAELMVMIKGTLGGIRTLAWSIVLISLPLYVVALILRETLGELHEEGQGAEQFATVPDSFFTVFRCVIAGECTEDQGRPIFLHVTSHFGWGYGVLYCCTMVFMTFGLFNVIVAIFVENVIAGAKFNDHIKKQSRLRDRMLFLDKTAELVEMIAEESEGHVAPSAASRSRWTKRGQASQNRETNLRGIRELELTPQLFETLRKQERFQTALRELDIAEQDQFDLFDTLDVDGSGTVDLDELLAGIAKLRGDPRRSDIVAVSLLLRSVQAEVRDFFVATRAQLHFVVERLRSEQALDGAFARTNL